MITSTSNSKVKRLCALCSKAKQRRAEKVFIVEGLRMFAEAPSEWIREIYVSETFLKKHGQDASLMASLERIHYETLSDAVFEKISDTMTPQGILSVLSCPSYSLDDMLGIKPSDDRIPVLLILEDLQDPGNLGTILRSGEGAGIGGVIMSQKTVDIFNPKVIRSTMGSIYRVPFMVSNDITAEIAQLKAKGYRVYAARLDDSADYDKEDYTDPCAFLIGNEGNGLKKKTAECAGNFIKIPMAGQVESLNAAAAATVLMYEAARQNRIKQRQNKIET